MRVVVTGGAGFIGSNLVRALVSNSEVSSVVALDDLSTGVESNLDTVDVEFRIGSILDVDLLDDVLATASTVVHLAARPSVPRSIDDPETAHDINATGTFRVLEAARQNQVEQVIVASSSSVYGGRKALPKTELTPPTR